MAFLFAFFYLRALNSNNVFHPAQSTRRRATGSRSWCCVLACDARHGSRPPRACGRSESGWRTLSLRRAHCSASPSSSCRSIEYIALPFTTGDGGLASVFWGWTALWLVCWLGAIYWMETLVAQTVRGGLARWRAGADAAPRPTAVLVLLATLAGIEVVAYICLYLIK